MRRNPTALALFLALSIFSAEPELSAASCDIGEGDVDTCITTLLTLPTERVKNTNELVIVLRVLDACEQRVQLTLLQAAPSAEVEASAQVASPDSVSAQLCELSHLHPSSPLNKLCGDVTLHSVEFPPTSTPKLRVQAEALRDLAISPVLEPKYFLHGLSFDLWIFSVFSDSQFHFYGPTRPTSPRPPLETWARETLALLDTGCSHEEPASTP